MVLYTCDSCNFSSHLKNNYYRHLKTMKHKKTITTNATLNTDTVKPSSLISTPSLFLKNPQFSLIFECPHCEKEYNRKDNLKRHLRRCKNKLNLDYKEKYLEMKEQYNQEKKEHNKQIKMLMSKVGDTTINNTIQLNSYGHEDLSHITDTMKTNMIKGPYGMIPKMIEAVHFNDNKPENKNIVIPNKKEDKLKVFSGDKWIYKSKDQLLEDLVDGKYFILDTHYENICNSLSTSNKEIYEKFRNNYDGKDIKFFEQLKKECEIVILNNR